MASFGKEARIITLLIIDVIFFLVEIIAGKWQCGRIDRKDSNPDKSTPFS